MNTNNNINKFYSKIEQVTNILFMDKKATLYLCLDFLGKLKILSSCKCLSCPIFRLPLRLITLRNLKTTSLASNSWHDILENIKVSIIFENYF